MSSLGMNAEVAETRRGRENLSIVFLCASASSRPLR